jgi:CRISPR-associated protein Cas5h
MNIVAFTYSAKFGHFLRAEANANGVTYPIPPRTVLLGLVGAVLGLGKDTPQVLLPEARLAVGGDLPRRFWHRTIIRKKPPAPILRKITAKTKQQQREEEPSRFLMEWLWKPTYRVWAALPEPYHADFAARLRERRWHFGPCMGLSEMLADLSEVVEAPAERLPAGVHQVSTAAPRDAVSVDSASACKDGLTLQALRMSVSATPDRVFSHRAYWVEHQGRPFPAETAEAWKCGPDVVVFL